MIDELFNVCFDWIWSSLAGRGGHVRTPEEEAVDGGVRTQELKSNVGVAFPPHLPPVIVNTKAGSVTA